MTTKRITHPDPDRILMAKLSGTAIHLARVGGSIDEAVSELREMAGGRGDLLAQEAGLMCGAWSVRLETGDFLVAAGFLAMAGAEYGEIRRWVEIGRERASRPMHSM